MDQAQKPPPAEAAATAAAAAAAAAAATSPAAQDVPSPPGRSTTPEATVAAIAAAVLEPSSSPAAAPAAAGAAAPASASSAKDKKKPAKKTPEKVPPSLPPVAAVDDPNSIVLPASHDANRNRPANRDYLALLSANCAIYHSMNTFDQMWFLNNVANFLTTIRGLHFVYHDPYYGYRLLMGQDPIATMVTDLNADLFKHAAMKWLPRWILGDLDPKKYHEPATAFAYRVDSNTTATSGSLGVWRPVKTLLEVKDKLVKEGPKNLLLLPEGIKCERLHQPPTKKRRGRPKKSTTPSKTPNKKAKTAENGSTPAKSTDGKRVPATEVWSGPPDDKIEGGWPKGWLKKKFERSSGTSKGTHDRYWFSPVEQYKFRSIKEVKKFLDCLKKTGGDETKAKKLMKD